MAKIKTKTNEKPKLQGDEYALISWFCAVWVMVILAFMPVFTHYAYGDVLTTKYGIVLAAGLALIGAFILWAIFARRIGKYISKMKSYADPETGKWFRSWCKATFSLLDVCVLVFLVMTVISTLFATPYTYQAFFGNEGRWNGALALIVYALTYFIISRYYRYKNWHMRVFLLVFLYMSVWAITDYFMLDIHGFKLHIAEEHYEIFVSSIGNIDTYTAVAMIPFAFAGIMFIQSEEKLWKIIFYWVCFFAAMLSMITSAADNAYLSFFAFFVFAPFIALKTRRGLRRYLVTAASFVSAIQLVLYWNVRFEGEVVKPAGVISICEKIPQIKYLMIALWIIVIVFYIYDLAVRKVPVRAQLPKAVSRVWLIIVIALFGVMAALFVLANKPDPYLPSVLEPAREYLVFDHSWGTWRGLVWEKIMELYNEFPFLKKLFGCGPETISIYLYNQYFGEIAQESGLMYDSPHNELLQMFVSVGPVGFIAYLGIYIAPSIQAAKRVFKKCYPVLAAVAIVCICHLFECWVNIMVPMDIPVIFALIAIAGGLYRKSANEVEE